MSQDTDQPSPDETRQILRERAKRLALPPKADEASPQMEVLVVTIGARRMGMETAHVVAALPGGELTQVPCTPGFIAGVISHRGMILTVLDLVPFLSLEGPENAEGCQVVAVTGSGATFGLLVSRVEGLFRIGLDALAVPKGDRHPFLRGMTVDKIAVLDLEALAGDQRIVVNDEVV